MKLLLLTRHFPPREGPLATWSFEMAERLATRCEDFSVCSLGARASERMRPGFAFDRLRPPPSATRPETVTAWGLPASIAGRFDVVLGTEWVPASLGLAWRGRSSVRGVFAAVHGPELEWRRAPSPIGRVYRRTAELALGHFDGVFAASGGAHALLEGVPVRRGELLGRACDAARFRPGARGALARALGVLQRRVLLSVGPLVPGRRIDKVLFALSALGVRYPDVCYVIAGEGPERERLELLAERLRVAHRVRFLGRVDAATLPEVYNLADVFVHLRGGGRRGLADADGVALLEALASARPVVVTARAAAVEGIDARTALIVPEDDSSALGDALVALLDHPERARRLGHSARAHVLATATWDLAADRLVAVMTDAVFRSREARVVDTASSTRDERMSDGAARSGLSAAALGPR
jgi:phosphatidylinositol alpha-1,6-mannosyltransferase